jgi:hypothetical protein
MQTEEHLGYQIFFLVVADYQNIPPVDPAESILLEHC